MGKSEKEKENEQMMKKKRTKSNVIFFEWLYVYGIYG